MQEGERLAKALSALVKGELDVAAFDGQRVLAEWRAGSETLQSDLSSYELGFELDDKVMFGPSAFVIVRIEDGETRRLELRRARERWCVAWRRRAQRAAVFQSRASTSVCNSGFAAFAWGRSGGAAIGGRIRVAVDRLA